MCRESIGDECVTAVSPSNLKLKCRTAHDGYHLDDDVAKPCGGQEHCKTNRTDCITAGSSINKLKCGEANDGNLL
jgi:hypothetical protein